ncbi:MAG: hypothetical protein HS132_03360 [Planctomycetia bacterium]|nr:hypothetical protein [Planctomycetia bacterium]
MALTPVRTQCVPPTLGLTIITHGWESDGRGWPKAMADAIKARYGADIPIYFVTLIKNHLDLGNIVVDQDHSDQVLDITTKGGAIIVIDWSDLDGGGGMEFICNYMVPTKEIGDVAFDYIFAKFHNNHLLTEIPIHLIGHSRGASVMSRIAYLLAQSGVLVDQLTTLDPHPLPCDWEREKWEHTSMSIWDNIIFADNYYRIGGGLDVPDGKRLDGAFNTNLTGILTDTEHAHTDVHTHYHGTIDLDAKSVGRDNDKRTIQDGWYNILLLPIRQPRDYTGYYLADMFRDHEMIIMIIKQVYILH